MDGKAQCIVCYRTLCRNSFFFIKRHYEASHGFLDNIKGNDRTSKLLPLKADFFKFMVDETDVPNDNNLSSNNEKLSLPFKKTLAKQCRPFDDGNFFMNLTTDALICFGEKCQEAVKLC